MISVCMGALSYADDITLISHSISSFKSIINYQFSICANFANNFCINFSCAKSIPI